LAKIGARKPFGLFSGDCEVPGWGQKEPLQNRARKYGTGLAAGKTAKKENTRGRAKTLVNGEFQTVGGEGKPLNAYNQKVGQEWYKGVVGGGWGYLAKQRRTVGRGRVQIVNEPQLQKIRRTEKHNVGPVALNRRKHRTTRGNGSVKSYWCSRQKEAGGGTAEKGKGRGTQEGGGSRPRKNRCSRPMCGQTRATTGRELNRNRRGSKKKWVEGGVRGCATRGCYGSLWLYRGGRQTVKGRGALRKGIGKRHDPAPKKARRQAGERGKYWQK